MKYRCLVVLLTGTFLVKVSLGEEVKTMKNSKTTIPKKEKSVSFSPQKSIELKESTVDIQGKKFRKLELDKEAYFVEALDSTNADTEIRVLCQEGHEEIPTAQITSGVKITQRSSLVVEGMRKVCKEAATGQKEVQMDPSVLMGLQIETGKNKNRKWLVSPYGINFKANW